MAWNPSPEVQVARDAAASLSRIHKGTVDRVVVVYTLANGQMGYASFGQDKALCGQAKALGDALYEAAKDHFEAVL